MKKFLFSLLFLIPFLSFSQNCTELQVTMFDSYGDGWNGNTLVIFNNNEETKRFQANIMMTMEATRKEVQDAVDEIIMEAF